MTKFFSCFDFFQILSFEMTFRQSQTAMMPITEVKGRPTSLLWTLSWILIRFHIEDWGCMGFWTISFNGSLLDYLSEHKKSSLMADPGPLCCLNFLRVSYWSPSSYWYLLINDLLDNRKPTNTPGWHKYVGSMERGMVYVAKRHSMKVTIQKTYFLRNI